MEIIYLTYYHLSRNIFGNKPSFPCEEPGLENSASGCKFNSILFVIIILVIVLFMISFLFSIFYFVSTDLIFFGADGNHLPDMPSPVHKLFGNKPGFPCEEPGLENSASGCKFNSIFICHYQFCM